MLVPTMRGALAMASRVATTRSVGNRFVLRLFKLQTDVALFHVI